jgi:hypothetical protein
MRPTRDLLAGDARPLLSCECVECDSHRGERDALRARIAELEHEDQIKTDADAACAMAATAEIDRLRAYVRYLLAQGDAMAGKRDALWEEVEYLREQGRRDKANIAALTAALRRAAD